MLNVRSLALQGIGFGPRHTALQGLVLSDGEVPTIPDVIPYGSGKWIKPEPKRDARRDRDDDVLLFLL